MRKKRSKGRGRKEKRQEEGGEGRKRTRENYTPFTLEKYPTTIQELSSL